MKKLISISLAACLAFTTLLATPVFADGEKAVEQNYQAIATGGWASAVIKEDGSLWTFGFNSRNQLGDGIDNSKEPERDEPKQIMTGVVSISSGHSFMAAIKKDGSLWMWGSNINGQLGNGTVIDLKTLEYQCVPKKVMDNVVSVSCGMGHTFAIKKDGSLWGWGDNYFGELDAGKKKQREYTKPIKLMDGVASVSAGDNTIMVIKKDGSLWGWGPEADLLGVKLTKSGPVTEPIKIMNDVVSVSAGDTFTLAIKKDDSLWEWGRVEVPGVGGTQDQYNPLPIKIMKDVAVASVGGNTDAEATGALIIKKDGSLWGGGLLYADAKFATSKKIMDGVVAVSCGIDSSLIETADGRLWGLGKASHGELGFTTAWSNLPDKILDGIALPNKTFTAQVLSQPQISSSAVEIVNAAIAANLVPSNLQGQYNSPISLKEFCQLSVAVYEKIKGEEIKKLNTSVNTTSIDIKKMKGLNVVNYGNDYYSEYADFGINNTLSRQDVAFYLDRLNNKFGNYLFAGKSTFADNDSMNSWAQSAVGNMQYANIMSAKSDNNFMPEDACTREECIVAIKNFYDFEMSTKK